MKVLVPEIATHVQEGGAGRNQEILSVDVHPSISVIVSAGAGENRAILWRLNTESKDSAEWLVFLAEMTATTFENTVNIVRFSPCGKYLACGDSNGLISILSLKDDCKSWLDVRDERSMRRVHLRGHTMDVQDFAWSPDSLYCASAAMDNFVIVWNVLKCSEIQRLKEHTHYAQGVAWSPDGNYIATASFDETVRINRVTRKSNKIIGCQETAVLKKPKLFADEFRAPTFSRRLTFSPEAWSGLLAVPGGLVPDPSTSTEAKSDDLEQKSDEGEVKPDEKRNRGTISHSPATHIFRFVDSQLVGTLPCATLSGSTQPSLAIRFHPSVFFPVESTLSPPWASFVSESRPDETRFVFAVATIDSVLVYDTQHLQPIAIAEKLHYASYTDLAWSISPDGASSLIASSRDGCFSILRFDAGELGRMMEQEPLSADPAFEVDDGVNLEMEVKAELPVSDVQMKDAPRETKDPSTVQSPGGQDENTQTVQSSNKKRRVELHSVGLAAPSPSANSTTEATPPPSKSVNTLQPRRVKLETIQPL